MKNIQEKIVDILAPTPEPLKVRAAGWTTLYQEKIREKAQEKAESICELVDIATVEAELRGLIWVTQNCYVSDGFPDLSKQIQTLQKRLKELKKLQDGRDKTTSPVEGQEQESD